MKTDIDKNKTIMKNIYSGKLKKTKNNLISQYRCLLEKT